MVWNAREEEAGEHLVIGLLEAHPHVIHAGGAHDLVKFHDVPANGLAIIAGDE